MRDKQYRLDEMEHIDYATDVLAFTSFWDNAQSSSIAEPEAQNNIIDLILEAQRHNVRLQTQLDTTRASARVVPVEPIQNPPDRPEQLEPAPWEPKRAYMAAAYLSPALAPIMEVTHDGFAAHHQASPLTLRACPCGSSAT